MKSISEAKDLAGKRVLVRVDFNVPVVGGTVIEDFRIKKALPTVEFLRKNQAKVILLAHLENEESDSLVPVFENLKKYFPVVFVEDFTSVESKKVFDEMQNGDVVLLQNIRRFPGEKKNDPEFSEKLASLGDVYVNEGFSVSHRAHASVLGLPALLPHYAGLEFVKEFENLSRALKPSHPFLFILGGAKFETKMPLVEKFLNLADNVFIGGALANDLLKAKGFNVGASLVSDASLDLTAIANHPKLILPSDVTLSDKRIVEPSDVRDTDRILDIGPATVVELKKVIASSKCILWNGPLGLYEQGFVAPTEAVAKIISESKADSIVGGGDTLAAISALKIEDKFTFLSTAGGAMLDFLANETLPGIEALK